MVRHRASGGKAKYPTIPAIGPGRRPLDIVPRVSFDLTETDRLLSTTRSVRKRLDLERPVEPEVILDCIRLAQQAPTGSNSQTWRWMVITDPAKRQAIADAYNEVGKAYLSMAQSATTDDPQTQRVYSSALALTDTLAKVPVHVIPCVQGRLDLRSNGAAASQYGSIMPAAWSFLLALRSRGLGSVWTTLHLFKETDVASLLGMPDDVTQIALFPVAYTVGTDFKPASRGPVEDITYFDTWGATP
jgi:nitroreductase